MPALPPPRSICAPVRALVRFRRTDSHRTSLKMDIRTINSHLSLNHPPETPTGDPRHAEILKRANQPGCEGYPVRTACPPVPSSLFDTVHGHARTRYGTPPSEASLRVSHRRVVSPAFSRPGCIRVQDRPGESHNRNTAALHRHTVISLES